METRQMICRENQWAGFDMIENYVMKVLKYDFLFIALIWDHYNFLNA